MNLSALKRLASVVVAAVLVSACEGDGGSGGTVLLDDPDGSSLAFAPPARLLTARAVVVDNLSLEVLIDDMPVAVSPRDDGLWEGQISLPATEPLKTFTMVLTWRESIDGEILELARATREFTLPANQPTFDIRIVDREFDATPFDRDNDGRSNLDERRSDTSPFDDADPGTPIVNIPLAVTLQLPSAFRAARAEQIAEIDVTASINNRSLVLTREGNVWRGETSIVQGTEAFVRASFYANSERDVRIAMGQSSVDGEGNSANVTLNGNDYEISDDDGDSLTNFQEFVDGTNPRDSNDPAPDPCQVSRFAPDCTLDQDGDGIPDSVEGDRTDTDGDDRPDFAESNTRDADSDGRFAHDDADEADPCIPSQNNDACRQVRDNEDDDDDDVRNVDDNCRNDPNPMQLDFDDDDIGNICDPTPGTEPGGTDTVGTDTAGTDTAGTDTAGTDTAGTDTAGTDTAGTDTAGTDTAGTDTAGTDTAGTDTAGTDTAGTDTAGTTTIDPSEPGTETAGVDTGQPGTGTAGSAAAGDGAINPDEPGTGTVGTETAGSATVDPDDPGTESGGDSTAGGDPLNPIAPLMDPGVEDAGGETGADPGVENPGGETGADPGVDDPGGETGADPGAEDTDGETGVDSGAEDPGGETGVDPGAEDTDGEAGADPGVEDPGGETGADPGAEDPGGETGADPGVEDPGGETGFDSGAEDPGGETGADPGADDPGGETGADPGADDPGEATGSDGTDEAGVTTDG